MVHFFNSLRSKLLLIYLITITVSAIILACVITFYFTRLISSQRDTLTKSTLNAICQNINTYIDDLDRISVLPYMDDELLSAFETVSDKSFQETASYNLCEAKQQINSSFNLSLDNNRNEVKSILVIYPDGKADYYNRYSEISVKDNYNFKGQDWYQSISAANGRAFFIDLHTEDYLNGKNSSNVFSIGRLIKDPNTQKNIAIIISNINDTALNDILDSSNFGVSSFIMIQDKYGNLVYSPQIISTGLQNQIYKNSTVITDNGTRYIKISKNIIETDWNVNVLMSYSQVQGNITLINITTAVLILMQIVIAFLLFSLWSHSLTNRFSKIRNVMRIAKNGDLTVRYRDNGNDDISTVGSDLNDMIIKINSLIERERKALISMKSAEYRALQSQINPHFIYNTLNGFIGLNRLGKRDTLEEAILSLSSLMRYILEHKEYTTLQEEFSLVTKYCGLQKIRFEDRLNVNISLEDSISDFKIPKLLLQPLVENAIIHGIEPLGRIGTLNISAAKGAIDEREFVIISVIDDGTGFDIEKLSEMKNVGINNVQERLKLSYHNAVLELTSQIGSGTRAIIKIETEAEKDF